MYQFTTGIPKKIKYQLDHPMSLNLRVAKEIQKIIHVISTSTNIKIARLEMEDIPIGSAKKESRRRGKNIPIKKFLLLILPLNIFIILMSIMAINLYYQ